MYRLHNYHQQTDCHGVVVACFDAELFGHWWFEGPSFLRDVLLTINADPDVELCTAEEYLHSNPPQKHVILPTGPWGEGGDHRVWPNSHTSWIWQSEYRCESLFAKLTYHLPWRCNPVLQGLLEKAGRELLLLQASDWPFVISRKQAVDYGIKDSFSMFPGLNFLQTWLKNWRLTQNTLASSAPCNDLKSRTPKYTTSYFQRSTLIGGILERN